MPSRMHGVCAAMLLLALLVGCGGGGSSPTGEKPVKAPSIASFTSADSGIQSGSSTTLTAVFANGIGTISPGVGNVTSGVPVTVSPTVDTTYFLSVTNSLGASAGASLQIDVTPPPPPPRLEAFYHLDGSLADETGLRDLAPYGDPAYSASGKVRPAPNQAYGPTHRDDSNGGHRDDFTALPEDEGITLAGWVWLPDESSSGVLFGFGPEGWDTPKLAVSVGWGFIWVHAGQAGDGFGVRYDRIGDTCWHHLALVLPKGFRSGLKVRFYLDGVEREGSIDSSATGEVSLSATSRIWGGPFVMGKFVSTAPGGSATSMKIDEVGVWSRELTPQEIADLAAPTGTGAVCENTPIPNWAPGPRFVPPSIEPTPELELGVHVLTDDTIAVISDPNAFLDARLQTDCGAYLAAMEENSSFYADWWLQANYGFAVEEVAGNYRTRIFDELNKPGHFTVSNMGPAAVGPEKLGLWPQATRETRITRFRPEGGLWYVPMARVVWYTYLKLPKTMVNGASYTVTDHWGDARTFTYDEKKTISWALKVNQAGYPADSAAKYAYFGSWLGANGGPLDGARYNGKPFQLCRESDDSVVFTGSVAYRGDEAGVTPAVGEILSGEYVYELDFSAFGTPGRYYVKLPGAGRSWAFALGPDAMGEEFYTHLRGLYHQRCASLDPARTAWPRGDSHHPIYRAAFPNELNDYADHSGEGWGFLDEEGKFPAEISDWFGIVAATATDEVVEEVSGEWHDAGDFDRFGHLPVIEYLAEAYLLYPQNFADGQGNIPESSNGIPDLLDEAVFGADLWRRLQEPDGRTALWVEATSHPKNPDPGTDTQRYYRSLATRHSSLRWAEQAARVARALKLAGADALAATYADSAKRAYAFALTDFSTVPRIAATFSLGGKTVTWTEPPTLDQGQRAKALVQLYLATGDAKYYDEMAGGDLYTWFNNEAFSLYWRGSSFDFVGAAVESAKLPTGWGDSARNNILIAADEWLAGQAEHAYRTPWRPLNHGYYHLSGWGNNEYLPLLHFIAAWRLTGDEKYRTAAQNGVNWMSGANPQGRSLTTGLGSNYVVHPLHLPSMSDGIADPVPGITIYGYNEGIPYGLRTWVFGLFDQPYPAYAFDGVAHPEMPEPWTATVTTTDEIGAFLYEKTPLWRRLANLENWNVPQMEFDVVSLNGPATAVTGCLLTPGWQPAASLKARGPRPADALKDMEWFHP